MVTLADMMAFSVFKSLLKVGPNIGCVEHNGNRFLRRIFSAPVFTEAMSLMM